MPLQKFAVFFLECFPPVVFRLFSNVLAHGLHIRFANCKRSIACLPCKSGKLSALCLDPFRGRCLDFLDSIADSHCAGEVKEDMDMVFDGIDEHGRATQVLQYRRHVGVKRRPDGFAQQALALFGAENEMHIQAREGLGHRIRPPFQGLGC